PGFLRYVLGLRVVTYDRAGDPVEALVVAPHQELVEPRLARADARHDLLVRQDPSGHAGRLGEGGDGRERRLLGSGGIGQRERSSRHRGSPPPRRELRRPGKVTAIRGFRPSCNPTPPGWLSCPRTRTSSPTSWSSTR